MSTTGLISQRNNRQLCPQCNYNHISGWNYSFLLTLFILEHASLQLFFKEESNFYSILSSPESLLPEQQKVCTMCWTFSRMYVIRSLSGSLIVSTRTIISFVIRGKSRFQMRFFLLSHLLCMCYFTPELMKLVLRLHTSKYTSETKSGMGPYKVLRISPLLLFWTDN